MARGSKIEWTEATWNPVTGCSKSAKAANIAMPKGYARD
jgi:protein gp37